MILAVNAGSSSMKVALFDDGAAEVLRGEIADGRLTANRHHAPDAGGGETMLDEAVGEHPVPALLAAMERFGPIAAVGHRVVHGGSAHTAPVRIDARVVAEIEALTPLAPLHQPKALAPIHAVREARPELAQVACFDTAFHATMPEVATRIALPPALGLRRYGFHGLSYEYIAGELAGTELAGKRVIVAHLGSGASLCAMRDGRSVETTMSMTALDGLVMATRPGALDPGVVLYLQQARGMDSAALEDLLYHHGGMSGVSAMGGDVRRLLAADDPGARAAIELFVYRVVQLAGGLVAVLGGLDGLVFTGGIGEHAAPIRERILAGLGWLGPLDIRVIATDEEAMIARHTRDVLRR